MNNETVVWSKPNCPYCVMTKNFLGSKNIKFEERMIGSEWTKQDLLAVVSNARTVPQIFLYGEYIGGYTELMTYAQNHDMYSNE